jgi:flavin-dependent dehydrogenase
MTTYDAVVVGGRVAGASTALLLARAGARVAVLDRGRYGSDTLSTHGLMRAGVLQLSRWGLLGQVVAAGTPPVRRTSFRYPDGAEVNVTIRPRAGVDALYAPRRHLLDRILVDAAAEAGADVLHETAVTGLLRDDRGRVAGVRARGTVGTLEMRARLTVGADGIGSGVARDVGAPVVRQGRTAGAALYRYVTGLPADGYLWAYGDHAAAGLIPTNDGQTCVFVATTPKRMAANRKEGSEAAFTSLLEAVAPELAERLGGASPVSRLHGWGGRPGFIRQSWGPGWALVGDAGYFKDPITTHGMTDALRDAELLAGAALSTLDGGVAEDLALGAYQRVRDHLSRRLFTVTDRIASYAWAPADVPRLMRLLSAAMSDEVDFLSALPPSGPSSLPFARFPTASQGFVGTDRQAAAG